MQSGYLGGGGVSSLCQSVRKATPTGLLVGTGQFNLKHKQAFLMVGDSGASQTSELSRNVPVAQLEQQLVEQGADNTKTMGFTRREHTQATNVNLHLY